MKLKYFYLVLSTLLMLIVRQELYAQFEQTTITEYENQYFQVRKTRSQNSDGSWTATSYKYVFDDSQYSAMVALNMVSKVIEETVSLEWYNANVLDNSRTKKLFTTITTYSNANAASLYLPSKIEKKIGDGPLQLLIQFLEYDVYGNLKKYKAKDGLENKYTYFTNNGKANLVSTHVNNANQTTSYDYVPLVGVSTVTDINGKTNTYEYDNFNRLKKVSDHVGQLKEYSYHYAGQTVENPISSAYSVTPPVCLTCGTDKYLNLDKSTWNLNASAAATSVIVTSNDGTWSVSSDASSWLSVSNITGATGNGSFVINTLSNTGTTTRTGTITVQSNSGIKSNISVSQASNSSNLAVSPDTWAPTATANNTTINVTSNVSWTATSQNAWLAVNDNTTLNGLNNGSFTLKVSANDGTSTRTGKVIITGGGLTREINVTQSGSSATLSISSTSWSTIANAGSTSISVTSNSNWTVSSNSGWLTISPASGSGNGSFTITANQNTGTSSRDGIITVTVGGVSQTVSVTQGTTSSSSCPDEVLVGKQGDADVVIKHFDSYYLLCTKSMSGTTARYVPRGKNYWTWSGFVKNSNVDQYYACINVNDSNYSGLASPFASNYVPTGWQSSTFLDPDNNPILYYYQNASSPSLSLSQNSWSTSASGNSTTVNVSSNVSWTASSNQTWLTLSPSSGSNNGTLTLSATQNTGSTARAGTVTVSGGGITQTVSVTQVTEATSGCPSDEVLVGKQGDIDVVIKHFDSYYLLCTKSISGTVTRYVPRGKNYWTWSGFVKNSNVDQYYACINVNDSNYSGLANPLPSGYVPTGWLSSTFLDPDNNPILYFYQNSSSPTLSLSQNSWSTSASGNSTTISVSSNVSWTATSNTTSWLTVSPSSGSNNGTLTLTATANAGESRSATITITGGGISQTVGVTQAAAGTTNNNICIVNKVRLLFRSDCCLDRLVGAKIQGSNNNSTWTDLYTITSNGTGQWQEFTFNNTTSYQYVRFQASANGYGELFEIEFYNGSTKLAGTAIGASQAIDGDISTFWHGTAVGTSNYAGLQLTSTCAPPSLSLSKNSWGPSASSNSTTVSVTSNVSWTVTSSDTWLSVSPGSGNNNGTFTLTAAANTTGASRSATITVTGGGISQTVGVTQSAAITTAPCIVNKVRLLFRSDCCLDRLVGAKIQGSNNNSTWTDLYTITSNGTGQWQEFTFNNTTSYQYVRFQASANGYGELFEIEFYNGSTKLAGTAIGASQAIDGDISTFWHGTAVGTSNYAGLQLTSMCAVIPPALSLSQTNWNPSSSSNTFNVGVISNVSWTATSSDTWLSVSPASGSNNGSLILTAAANTGAARTANIAVTGESITQIVTVNQAISPTAQSCIVNKVRLLFRNCCVDRLVGAKIQGSNNNSNWTDLYTITSNATSSWQEFTFSNSNAYQYVRFQSSANGFGELLELEFYSGSTKLTGTVIGGSQALDGDITTLWHGTAVGTINYAGLQLSNTCSIAAPTLSLSQNSWSPSFNSSTTNVGVISNVSWTATSSDAWLTVSPSSGSNNGSLILTAAANTGVARAATITVTGEGATQIVTVNQAISPTAQSCIVNKVRLLFRNCCVDRLVGAKIQGSNNNSDWTDLYTITSNATSSWQEFTFSNSNAYEYVRFQASANGFGELLELEFYSGSTKLTGTVIGGSQALDGDITTLWHGTAVGTINYAGLQLSNTCSIAANCGDTPQNYCLTGTIPANQFRFYSNYASTNIAGPRSSLDGGTPPFYGNAGWLQGYAGGAGNMIYPTYQNDINLPIASSGYRVDLWWPNSTSKVLRLYVNGVQKWSQATTCQDYCQYYPDFSSVVSGDRVYFSVQENATLRIAAENDVYQTHEEPKDDVLVVSPNPTDGKVKAEFYLSEAQSVRLSVIDTQGRIVGIYDKDADAGANMIDLDLQQYASGTYLIQLRLANKQLVTKVIKQ